MRGPEIMARTMSVPTARGGSTRKWEYHSRSDSHSRLACWTMVFDLMLECDVVRSAAESGRIGFRINHVMVGPINKTLDLVVTVTPPGRTLKNRRTFAGVGESLGIVLDQADRAALAALPPLMEDKREDISEVAIALEAKACMTEHVKSLPRLHAEILATGYLARLASRQCISVSYSMVNAAPTFVTPSGQGKINRHNQPEDARRVLEMLEKAVPIAGVDGRYGYDIVGATVIECANDGSPVRVVDCAPAPQRNDRIQYERMIRALCSEFRSRFRF